MTTIEPTSSVIVWSGKHPFSITGTGRHEDTLRIEAPRDLKAERPLSLTLPTLCITYADMGFQNAVGGGQEDYPGSAAYGPAFFDPAVDIVGEEEVERLTWIRGAHHVSIGPRETLIEWYPWHTLVIPRLRIDTKDGARALLQLEDIPVRVEQPLIVRIKQLADGRHVGGIRVEKRHPDWRPPEPRKDYDLRVRVVNGSGEPQPEALVRVLHWDGGGFTPADQRHTDGYGVVEFPHRPADDLEAVVLDRPGWRATPRAFRPLPGQQASFALVAWPLKKVRVATLIDRPAYLAAYRVERPDDFESVATRFGFRDMDGLAKANGLPSAAELRSEMVLRLPDWYFVHARADETLGGVEKVLGLPRGSARTVGPAWRPTRGWVYDGEVVAVPAP